MTETRWLRVSYWVGAIADGVVSVMMFFPELGRAVYGLTDFEPAVDYRYAMRFGASLMFGWAVLLLWADRKPLERRGVLPITVLVIAGLAWAGAYAVDERMIPLANMIPSWGFQLLLVVLFVSSYARAGRAAAKQARRDGASSLAEAAAVFLSRERFAVAGVSRTGRAPANLIFDKLKSSGCEVYAINPNADTIDGERCYASLADLPEAPDAVIIATHPDQAIEIARQCEAAGVGHVWFHRSIDRGSYSREAADRCAGYGAVVIPGGCPMMHLEPVDVGHRCMRGLLTLTGRLPDAIESRASG